jgi:hypothetical protein
MGCISSKRVFEAEEIELEKIQIKDLRSFYEHMNNLMSANHNRNEDEESAEDDEEAEQPANLGLYLGNPFGNPEAEQPANLGPYLGNPFGNPFVNERRSKGG